MKKYTFRAAYNYPKLILGLILVIFFLKGMLLTSAFPIFDGQDEARHYNTVQYLLQPSDVSISKKPIVENKDNFKDYNFSQEITEAGTSAGVDSLRSGMYNTVNFSNSYYGLNEVDINSNNWKPYNFFSPADIAYGGKQIYHHLASLIERAFSEENILVRFYSIRILSVLLGTFTVLLSYLIAKTIDFSSKHALLISAIISFQPKFSMYFAGINYDVLVIPMFALFTYAAVLILKQGLNWKNFALSIFSITIAILTKSTGFILTTPFAVLLAYLLFMKMKTKGKKIQYITYVLAFIAFALLAIFLKNYLPTEGQSVIKTLDSIGKYLSKSLTIGRFALSSRTYWGTFGWSNSWIMNNITNLIWLIEGFALAGMGLFFFNKKNTSDWLPEKKYIVFLIGMIIALQLGIRTADWAWFTHANNKLITGTPGRYFLPNLASHIILVYVGLGMLFEWISLRRGSITDGQKYFDYSLIAGLILMFSFSMYLIFDVILYRFYL